MNSTPERREELTALRALGILNGEDVSVLETCVKCPLSQTAQDLAASQETVSLLETAESPSPPPSADMKTRLKQKLLMEIADDPVSKDTGFAYVGEEDGEWTPLPSPGARIKELSNDGHTVVFLLELDPGGRIPSHTHHGREQGFVISGDLHTSDRTLHGGDYFTGAPGSKHHDLHSVEGCRAILITEKSNYPQQALKTYGALHRAVGKLRDLLSPKS